MKINIAKSAGFCFGVKRAIEIALGTASRNKKVYMLGDIVHNEEVAKQIREAGIKKVRKLPRGGKGKTILIRAHGISYPLMKKARQRRYKVVDATCPMVKEIHKIARDSERKGYVIIVIGDRKHDEVQGIIGGLRTKAVVIENEWRIPWQSIKRIRKFCVVVQSTQNLQRALKIVEILRRRVKKLKFYNTICRPTRIKQAEISRMPQENDIMIIIGSKTSANTKRLYEISKAINKNSYWIQSTKEIKPRWFKNVKSAGITAGASTPDYTTQQVIAYIKQLLPSLNS